VLGPGEWRYALDKLGFESVTKQLSDAEIEKLMTGPDRLFADKDRLIDEKDAFGVFDSDKYPPAPTPPSRTDVGGAPLAQLLPSPPGDPPP
jgi:hypothetical protein